MPSHKKTVFIVDDDDAIRQSLSRSLRMRGFEVAVFASAQEFLDTHDAIQEGCIILDYGMPEMSGLELQKELLARDCLMPIIFITGHGGVPESVQAIRAGALDFLEKPFRPEVLVERINDAFVMMDENRVVLRKVQRARTKLESLTPREAEIVQMMVENPSNTSSKDIARALDISPRTVDHHRARILEKLAIKSVAELIELSITAKEG